MKLPNYQNYWIGAGYGAQVEDWEAAGINHLVIDPVSATGDNSRAIYEIMDTLR